LLSTPEDQILIPRAHIVHIVPGSMRIKIPSMRHVDSYFAALEDALKKLPGVTAVSVSPLASSLRLQFDPKFGEQIIARFALDHELFELEPHVPWTRNALTLARKGALKANRKLRTADGEHYDKRALLVLLLLALSVRQIRQGQILNPAANLLWNAYTLLENMGVKETPKADDNSDSSDGDG